MLAALFLLGTINNCAGFRDGASEIALGVHVTDLLRSANNLAADEKQGKLVGACEAMEEGLQDLFVS